MTLSKKFFAAAVLVAAASSAAVAQTDFGSPIGAGAGIVGSVVPIGVPGSVRGGTNAAFNASQNAVTTTRAAFVNATSAGVSVVNPAGGTVNLPQPAAQALGAVLGGNSGSVPALVTALGGGTAAQNLANALARFGAAPAWAETISAVQAYNAAVDALPAGQNPSPALLAVRATLATVIQARANSFNQ